MSYLLIILVAALVLGAGIAGGLLSFFSPVPSALFNMEIWGILALIGAIGLGWGLYLFIREKKRAHPPFQPEFERFKKESKQVIRGHLKASILFWIHFYRKEKAKSLDDAKKEIFHDLKREFTEVPWMGTLLDEIRQEISKYK